MRSDGLRIRWQCCAFDELGTRELYELLKLRVDVFVVEQACPYAELDNKDHPAGVLHLLGRKNESLVASARLLPPGLTYASVSIGRVVTHPLHRGGGLGHHLLETAIALCEEYWPGQPIEIGAQQHLCDYYRRHGFVQTSDSYLEDGIAHVDMKREA